MWIIEIFIIDRISTKNVTFPYATYAAHFVLGIIYTRTDESIDERRVYRLDDLLEIASVIKDFQFLLQEKWRIASDHPGSGNTKNIGSVRDMDKLIAGQGLFFTDVGAIVYYLKAVPWLVPGFSVATHLDGLLALQDKLEKEGQLRFEAKKFLIETRKPV